ncbi:unnamed protein product [Eretmochelys imbricata]
MRVSGSRRSPALLLSWGQLLCRSPTSWPLPREPPLPGARKFRAPPSRTPPLWPSRGRSSPASGPVRPRPPCAARYIAAAPSSSSSGGAESPAAGASARAPEPREPAWDCRTECKGNSHPGIALLGEPISPQNISYLVESHHIPRK